MPPRSRMPLVRPPRMAAGGAVAPPFGMSGAPGIPVPNSRRAQLLAVQYADDERGRFTERVFPTPPFDPLSPGGPGADGATQSQIIKVVSNRTSFVRMVALRGVVQSSTTPSPFDPFNVTLQMQINGEEEFSTSGDQTNPTSFAVLFANTASPWWWFAAPPRLRVGDIVQITCNNTYPIVEGAPNLTPQVALRLVDDEYWRALYGG